MTETANMNPGRRSFLLTAPFAAAAGWAIGDAPLLSAQPGASSFELFTAQSLQDDFKALQAKPGNNPLLTASDFAIALTVETAKSAREFEWHEQRDHVLQIVEGSTVVEVGGTPRDARNTKPGEWLAPASDGSTALTLSKGDMLIIPRGTPHKRSTAGTVTLILISPGAPAKP